MARLNDELQREEAIYDMKEYSRVSNRLLELKQRIDNPTHRLSYQEKEETTRLIGSYTERQIQLGGMLKYKYDVENPREIDRELQKAGIDFREFGFKYGERDQGSAPVSISKHAAEQAVLEKADKAIMAAREYEAQARKLEEVRAQGENNYREQEKAVQKAFKEMQQANMELTQSTARLRELMGQTPSQQQDTILKPEIQKAFGTKQPSKAFDDIYEQQMKLDKDKEKDQTRSP